MDLAGVRIPPAVTAKQGENPCHRRGMGSLTMIVSQGLGGPKVCVTHLYRKGNRLIFLSCTSTFLATKGILPTHRDSTGRIKILSKQYSTAEYHHDEKQYKLRRVLV